MLTENDIVKKVSAHLEANGYDIIQSLSTAEKGVDIIAKKNGQTLYIEAKGQTSSNNNTERFGKPFTKSQIKSHISRAIFASMTLLSARSTEETEVAIALPETKVHRGILNEVYPTLLQLNIQVFWVSESAVTQE